jgi:hypothetical protein
MGRGKPGIPRNEGPRRPHHSTVIAWLALFIALGGVAAGLPGNNGVGSKDIRGGAVRASEIHRDAVRASKLEGGAVTQNAIAADAIGTPELLDGAVSPAKIGDVPAARVDTPQQGPGCTSQVIEDGQTEVLEFSIEAFDAQGMHADPPADCAAGDQSRLTAPIDGTYIVTAAVGWPSNGSNRRSLEIVRTNIGGTQGIATDIREAVMGANTEQSTATAIDMSAGDYVQARVTQNSGLDLTLTSSTDTYISMVWVGPSPQ